MALLFSGRTPKGCMQSQYYSLSKPKRSRKRSRAAGNASNSDSDSDTHRHEIDNRFNIRVIDNAIYFNNDITRESVFRLNFMLRRLEKSLLARSACLAELLGADSDTVTKLAASTPVHLHVTTNGGEIDAAFSCVDCIKGLRVPVVTVVDGYVASAGTLITLAGAKRVIMPNAKMLIHQLRTGMWGKHAELVDQYENSNRTMEHLIEFYTSHTKIKRKRLEKILKRDVEWNADECIAVGLVDEIVKPTLSAAGAPDNEDD